MATAMTTSSVRMSAPALKATASRRTPAAAKAAAASRVVKAGVSCSKASAFVSGARLSSAGPTVAARARTMASPRSELAVESPTGFHADDEHDPAKQLLLSDVVAYPRKNTVFGRNYTSTDWGYVGFMGAMHALCFLMPMTFSWANVGLFMSTYVLTGMIGITLSFHRQLSHKAFKTPKWLEYVFAYCGVLAVQGDPLEWVSSHRHHHKECDTPKDPHSPYEGFWWSHMGWLLDEGTTLKRVGDRSNANDMAKDKFYVHLQKHYVWHVVAQFAALFAFGGLPAVIWGGAARICWVYHITWFVNSASHVWGSQKWNTGDLSRNNWWVGILAFGEGWHNNHHAFEYSARHGLEWWQWDPTWYTIKLLEFFGLASNVKYPREEHKQRLAFN